MRTLTTSGQERTAKRVEISKMQWGPGRSLLRKGWVEWLELVKVHGFLAGVVMDLGPQETKKKDSTW